MRTYTKALVPRAREMRTNMTEPEKRIWYHCLRHLSCRFRRQRPFGPYIVDFYCPALRLAIEVDGDSHATADGVAYDAERTAFLEGLGVRVIRFANHDVMHNIEGVFARLQEEIGPRAIPQE